MERPPCARPTCLDTTTTLLGSAASSSAARFEIGVATALCATVEAKARVLGFDRLYLFTIDRQSLYARIGWTPFERARWRDHEGDLMVKWLE